MLFYVQMRWNYQGRISQDQLWDLEALEGEHGVAGIRSGFVQLYKVVSQHRIIAIVRADSLDDLDRNSMGWLPMREYLEFEAVWALRDYEGFLADVKGKFPAAGTRQPALPAPVPAPPADEAMTRKVAERWFGALGRGDGAAALACLADDVIWVNAPPFPGVSDIVPWLGEYDGRAAVEASFAVWARVSQVRRFEVRKLVIAGDEAIAVIHEVATIKATGLDYDIEFIHRIRVADDRIASWRAYWDTAAGIVAFRGDMPARLVRAAERGDTDEAMLVLPFGADPNTLDPDGLPVLALAAARGHEALVRLLLDHGADPDLLDRRGGAGALHKACQGGHAAIARMLVEAGAWIDVQAATTGHTPLMEAIWYKSDETVRDLLNRDARIDLETYYGFTLDDHIAYALRVSRGTRDGERLARIQELVAQRRARDRRRAEEAAGVRAALSGDRAGLRAALDAGAGLEDRFPVLGGFEDGHTALLVAARDGHAEIVADLIAAGADVNAVEPVFGAVPLHKATYNGHAGIARMLAAAPGIDLDARGTSNGYTPLLDALWHGFADCAAILLDAGARTDLVGDDSKTARDLAAEKLGPDHPLVARLSGSALPAPSPALAPAA